MASPPEAERRKLPLGEIDAAAERVIADIPAVSDADRRDELAGLRRDYLKRQLEALRTRVGMLQGAKLYRALNETFKRFDGSNQRVRPICFETFPHAIACTLNGEPVPARDKRRVRRALLEKADVCCDSLTNIDFVDAALCALTAQFFSRRRYTYYGDAGEGCIVVPLLI